MNFQTPFFFLHNVMLLFCVNPWNKSFVYQTCVAINSYVFYIMEMFTSIKVHGFGKWTPWNKVFRCVGDPKPKNHVSFIYVSCKLYVSPYGLYIWPWFSFQRHSNHNGKMCTYFFGFMFFVRDCCTDIT